LRIAFTEPGAFVAVATHSAMLLEAIPDGQNGAGRGQMAAFRSVFGDPIDESLWQASDPLRLATRVDPKTAPALYFDCGAQDRYGLAGGQRKLEAALAARQVPHTAELPSGDHGYEYVRTRLPTSLRFLDRALRPAPTRTSDR
jgi:S-formylglutathione hydrolase FrmB